MRRLVIAITLGVCLVAAAGTNAAAQPAITNGAVTTRNTTGPLATELEAVATRQGGVVWAAYSVPANRAGREACCNGTRGGCRCSLESTGGHDGDTGINTKARNTVQLEGPAGLAVFIRFEAGRFSRVLAFSEGCPVDAGGKPVVWLTGVKPPESVAWLSARLTGPATGRRHAAGPVMAMALHASPDADHELERLAASSTSSEIRESAVFWMGAAREAAGFAALQRLLKQETETKLREHVMFGLSVSHEPGALPALAEAARHDPQARVRAQAWFWLAQKAGTKVAADLATAIERDPDADVKVRAVFALSQLPKDEGVPQLIGVARGNKNAEVRRQAMFWLGQSGDPRAMAFIEQVLFAR
jgi:hypothetical protein